MLKLSYRSEMSQASRQRCCRGACQMSERLKKYKLESRGFETSRDLAVRRLTYFIYDTWFWLNRLNVICSFPFTSLKASLQTSISGWRQWLTRSFNVWFSVIFPRKFAMKGLFTFYHTVCRRNACHKFCAPYTYVLLTNWFAAFVWISLLSAPS